MQDPAFRYLKSRYSGKPTNRDAAPKRDRVTGCVLGPEIRALSYCKAPSGMPPADRTRCVTALRIVTGNAVTDVIEHRRVDSLFHIADDQMTFDLRVRPEPSHKSYDP